MHTGLKRLKSGQKQRTACRAIIFFLLTPIFIMQSAVCIQHNDIIIESCGVTLISDAP
jgi:hypothetical protein